MRSFIHSYCNSYVKTFIVLLLLGYSLNASAQTCNGTWGIPIINQTFGVGTSNAQYFGPLSQYAPGVTTSTQFVTTQIADNYSCLSQNAFNGNSNGWVNIGDHTGEPNGLMFLINAPSTASTVFFEYTMNDLCPNTVLQFSVWILNTNTAAIATASNYQYPNMQINLVDAVTGVSIASTSTGNIAADQTWHNFTLNFNNGTSSSVKMQLVNNSIGSGYGNDLALDDITIRPCVPVTHILPKLDTMICHTKTLSFTSSITGNVYSSPEYLWQYSTDSGKTWQTLVAAGNVTSASYTPPNVSGSYWVRFLTGPTGFSANSNCTAVSDTSKIMVDEGFTMPTVADTSVCYNSAVKLQVSGAASYSWIPATGLSCNTCAEPTAAPSQTTTYRIIGSDNFACFDTVSLTVHVDTPTLSYSDICPGTTGTAIGMVKGNHVVTYNWLNDDGLLQQTNSANGDTLKGLTPGDYIVNMHTNNVCDTTYIFTIGLYPVPVAAFAVDSIICIGQPHSIDNQSTGYISLAWDMGDGTQAVGDDPKLEYAIPGDHTITLIARNEHCADTATHPISVKDFHLQLTSNGDTVLSGQQIQLQTSGSDAYTVSSWQPAALFADQTATSQSFKGDESNTYTVIASSQFGCPDTASVSVGVKSFWFIPSAFTPNGDGKNDYFKPIIIGNNGWKCIVFDRWGKVVYSGMSSDGVTGWDGSTNGIPGDIGVYYYVIDIQTNDGNEQRYTGEVTLLR